MPRKKSARFPLYGLVMAAFVLATLINPHLRYRVLRLLDYPFHYEDYKHFGIRLPEFFGVHGIDVSRYQEHIDWEQVARMRVGDKRIHFAFIKATEGSWIKDPYFDHNWEQSRRYGIIRGAYHYFLPDISPIDQANHFIRTVNLQSGDLPPVVDIEEARGMTPAQVRKHLHTFLRLLRKHYGVRPIIYTSRDFYKNYFSNQAEFKPYAFWVAHYYVNLLTMPDGSTWHFWQHNDQGRVNGIKGAVDFNVFRGDSTELRKLCLP
ncbi:MAG: glycoside hydrolase family 25 protein [Saprospiraceae bacterium]|nr:glycoside hydrolase family 25 protein [Saprospiraceae bacterium]MDW8482938.1 glycoside hydrolase family 25 protein [Saprospiraceae bacterium]